MSGGDQRIRGDSGYKDEKGVHRLNVLDLQRQIRTCPKPLIAMVAGYAIGGGQDEHGHRTATRAQSLEHIEAVHFGQTQIQDEQVELVGGHEGSVGFGAGGHMIDRRARRPERSEQAVGQHLIVFGDEYAHLVPSVHYFVKC